MTATTALTAQNTQGVTGIHETPSEFVKKCIDACAEDVGIDVVKTGKFISLFLVQRTAILDYYVPNHPRLELIEERHVGFCWHY